MFAFNRVIRWMFVYFLILSLVTLVTAVHAQAQGVEPLPGADPGTVVSIPDAVEAVARYILGVAIAAFGASPVTAFLVGLAKKISIFNSIPAEMLSAGIALILWLLQGLATALGYNVQFESLLALISGAGPLVVGFLITLLGAPMFHAAAVRNNVVIMGYVRTPDARTERLAA